MRRDEARKERLQRILIILGGVILVFLIADKLTTTVMDPTTPEQIANQLEEDSTVRQHALQLLEKQKLAGETLVTAEALQDELQNELGGLEKAAAELDASIEQVRTDTSPNSIAGDRQALQEFQFLLTRPRPTPGDVDHLANRAAPLYAVIEEAKKKQNTENGATISRDTIERMQDLREEAQRKRKVVDELQTKLDALVKYAKPADSAPDTTVQQAMADMEAEVNKQALEAQTEAVREVRQEYEQKLADTAAQTERILQEARHKQLLDERQTLLEEERLKTEIASKEAAERLKKMEQEADAELAKAEQARKRAQLEREFAADRPRIERLLQPFITPGKAVPESKTQWSRQLEPTPLSLTFIKGQGALQDTPTGHQAFMWIAGNTQNDRNKGSYPDYIGGAVNPGILDSVLAGQELLRKYGDLLVDKDMLLK